MKQGQDEVLGEPRVSSDLNPVLFSDLAEKFLTLK